MSKNNKLERSFKRGFTVIELLVIAPIVLLTIGAFITVIVNMVGEVLASRSSAVLVYNIQDALNRIESDVKSSTTFLAQNNVKIQSPQGFNNGTGKFNNVYPTDGDMLILNTLATSANPISATASLIYLTDTPNGCTSTQVSQNTPLTMNVVYFIKNNTLWRRSIMPANYATAGCSVPWQQPSCNPTYMAANPGAPIAFCKTQDIDLVDNITTSDFHIQYFDTADGTTVNTVASDSTQSVDTRNASLESSTTISASITVNTTTAGRNISQSGSIRVTKLDTNASTIAPVTAASIPDAPDVTTSLSQPASVVVNWPDVAGATGYTVDYNVNGGSWTNGFTNQASTTYTVTAASHQDTVNVRVSATNSAGTSDYGTANLTIPLWASPTLENNWSDYNTTYASAGYTKTKTGIVMLKGLIKRSGSVVSDEVLLTLPAGYRPQYQLNFNQNITAYGTATIYVSPDGTVRAGNNTSAVNTSLSGISFIASDQSYVWTNFATPFGSGWSNRGNTDDPPLSYTFDSIGRVHIRGHLSPGTLGADIVTLPVSAQISPKWIVAVRSGCNGYNAVNVGTTITHRGSCAGSLLAVNLFYYPTTPDPGWTTLPLSNGWVVHSPSTNAIPEYTKASDGIVTIKGLIKSGSTTDGTVVATLPANFRPAEINNYACVSNENPCRLSIEPSGNIKGYSISSNWLSLSGIHFIAEQ